jgi:FixJ family two-component response regulator
MRLGAAEFLHKPADLDELCETVQRYCPSSGC